MTPAVTPYYKVQPCTTSPHVLLIFSAANVKPGSFLLSNVLSKFKDASVVFLNSPKKRWYLEGIPGLGHDIESTAKSLAKLVESLKGPDGKVIAFGGSMGGYGALLYGCMIEADTVVTAGVETDLYIEGGIAERSINPRIESVPNIQALMASAPSTCHFYYGEDCLTDLMCAIRIEDSPKAHVWTFVNRGHPIPPYLHKRYGLDSILLDCLRDNVYTPTKHEHGTILEHPKLIRLCYRLFLAERKNDTKIAALATKDLSTFDRAGFTHREHGYADMYLSKGYALTKQNAHALRHSEKAYEHNPDNILIAEHQARQLDAAGKPKEALAICRNVLKQHDPDTMHTAWGAHVLAARLLCATGKKRSRCARVRHG